MKSNASLKNKSLKLALLGFSILALAVFATGWYFSYKYSKNVKNLKVTANHLEQEANQMIETVQKYNRVNQFQPVVADTLPSSKDVSSFLADVENIAKKNNILLSQSTIGTTNAKSKQVNLDLSQTVNKGDYYELQIKYSVMGSYMNFLTMLEDLSNLRRLNNISEINIIKEAKENSDNVQINFVDTIFIKK